MRYDAVIVGSGVSGLTAAIILAKEGRKVLVVEQHTNPGGLMQLFRRGVYRFPTGVHRLGALGEGQILWRYFKYLGVIDHLQLDRLDPDGFEEYCLPGLVFRVPEGTEAFQARLHQYFPSEKSAIDQFCENLQRLVSQYALYNLDKYINSDTFHLDDDRSLLQYLNELGCSLELKAVLSACNPLYGISPEECPLSTHFLVLDSFLKSSWRIDEYATPLAQVFVQSLLDHGGELRCRALVTRMAVENQQVRGVILAEGEFIPADLVIFTGHPRNLLDLCPQGSFRPAFTTRLEQSQDSFGAFSLALSWDHPDCPLAKRDTFLYNSLDMVATYRQTLVGTTASPNMIYCSGASRPVDGGYSVVALTCMAPQEMVPFEASRLGKRSAEYQAAKESVGERVLGTLKTHWPTQAHRLKIVDAATPLTYRHYTLTPRGTAYGIIKTTSSARHNYFSTKTKIRNLFLAGQSIILPGILGALISGVQAVGIILDRDSLLEKIKSSTQ